MKKLLLLLSFQLVLLSSEIIYNNQHVLDIKDKNRPECIHNLLLDEMKNNSCTFYTLRISDWKIKEKFDKYSIICETSQNFCVVISNKFVK